MTQAHNLPLLGKLACWPLLSFLCPSNLCSIRTVHMLTSWTILMGVLQVVGRSQGNPGRWRGALQKPQQQPPLPLLHPPPSL